MLIIKVCISLLFMLYNIENNIMVYENVFSCGSSEVVAN